MSAKIKITGIAEEYLTWLQVERRFSNNSIVSYRSDSQLDDIYKVNINARDAIDKIRKIRNAR